MSRGVACILVAAALGAAACSAAAADETSTGGSAPPTASEPVPSGPVAPARPAASDSPVAAAEGTSPGDLESGEPVLSIPIVAASPAGSIDDEVAGDEPTFEVEPLQPLDLDAAVFAVDDAGIGVEAPAATTPPATGWAGFDAALGDALLRNGNTAVSVAVSIDGDVVHTAAFGWRTRDGRDAAEPGDRFRIASISKTLTSVALLQLVEDGVVGLDDPVGGLVASSLGVTTAAGVGSITVRQLLNHTSGFGKYDGVFFRGQAVDCRDAASIGLRSALSGSPGGSYRYSNMNYCVAGLLLEALTGRSYETVVYEQVLTPLGLSGLRLSPTFDPGPGEVQHPTTTGRNYMETLGAAGAWLASPEDLVIVVDSLDLSTPGWKPLELDTALSMQTPVGGQFGQRGYGMGLILYGPGRYGHTGTIESTHAMVQNRGDGVIWAITVSGPYPSSTPQLEVIINRAFEAGGFVAG